jgi:predicted rRNA methylase YqxC with S4 and FtsJ domains
VLQDVNQYAEQNNLSIQGLIRSPMRGAKGNVEYLMWLSNDKPGLPVNNLIRAVL